MLDKPLTLAALGCTGNLSEPFVVGFLKQGIKLRLLARNPEEIASRYPEAETIKGSMMNKEDVAKAMTGVDAAFIVTPMGICNDQASEVNATAVAIEAARSVALKHLILVSAIGIDQQTGVPLLDAKHKAERLLAGGEVPWTSIRCGSYMEDVITPRIAGIRRGRFMFPVTKTRRFTYTCQGDVPRFVIQELLVNRRILNGPLNFVSPGTFTPETLAELMSIASGRRVRASGKFPMYYLFMMLKPYFHLRRHRFATLLPLVRYFDRNGFVAPGKTVEDHFPNFRMTTIEDYIRGSLPSETMPYV
jgi:uncharacterized protein YbjT (DUF2867 family)